MIVMEVDYKHLCEELFGTSDPEELKAIADLLNVHNPRGAGRKPKFSEAEIQIMKDLAQQGVSKIKIAEQFHTTRQTVARCIEKLAS